MKGLLALYLILLLVLPGCMMAPMALLPWFTERAQPRAQPQPQPQAQAQMQAPPQAQAQTESTGTQTKEPGQRLEPQKQGEIRSKP